MVKRIKSKFEYREILKFLVGGGSAVAVDFIAYMALKSIIDMSVAKAISYVMGAAMGFLINKYWTFESKTFRFREIFKYIILYSCSALINILVNKLALYVLKSVLLGFYCATGISTIINFLGQKFFVFSGRKEESDR